MTDRPFTATAASIGDRLVDRARGNGRPWSWTVRIQGSGADRREAELRPAGPALYQGTAGIALFLGELAGVTGEARFAAAARDTLSHALTRGAELPETAFGFHGGRVGIAWVAVRVAAVLDAPALRRPAKGLLSPLAGNEHRDGGLDVIAGAAGAIPALLDLARRLERDDLLGVARRLGEHLIVQARKEPGGWSWDTLPRSSVRGLTGFAHGASGAAVALLELARATGEGRFRFAAEMAFLYERRTFDPEAGNWPDYRHTLLGDHLRTGRIEEVRRAVRAGRFPPYRPHFMTAWCHGAPGIGLARLRAWELTGDPRVLDELRQAVETTRASVDPEALHAGNFSLCHGAAGNAELLLEAGRRLDEPEWIEAARQVAEIGRDRYESSETTWPCGTVDGRPDPSLLVGEAGIGLYCLRLDDASIPSVLLVRPAEAEDPNPRDLDAGFRDAWSDAATAAFRTTRRVLRASAGSEAPEPPVPGRAGSLEEAPAEAAARYLEQRLEAESEAELRTLLDDAFRFDLARNALLRTRADHTLETLRRLARPPADEAPWGEGRFCLPPTVRFRTLEWDWTDPPASGAPAEGPVPVLLVRENGRVAVRKVGPLAAVVLEALEEPARVADVVEVVARALGDGDDVDRRLLTERVREQMGALYEAGLVDPVIEPAGETP